MRLDKYLLSQGLAESRSKAVHLIKTGQIQVNDSVCTKQSYKVKASDVVETKSSFKYVSRAGYKMEATFMTHDLNVKGHNVLDIGCSTGGFSDFFLQEGAAKVVGLDVALGCVDRKLLKDPRFSFMGGANACDVKSLESRIGGERFDLISTDVSNSLLEEVLPKAGAFLKRGGLLVALFKPPYEVDRRIRSDEEMEGLTREFDSWLLEGYEIVHKDISPIKGGSKNKGTMEVVYVLRLIATADPGSSEYL
jgi:23S rRNA (cytidine1920-2'-O)/16S rRNA (cytidine1409-2'-O)-methyltransferase